MARDFVLVVFKVKLVVVAELKRSRSFLCDLQPNQTGPENDHVREDVYNKLILYLFSFLNFPI